MLWRNAVTCYFDVHYVSSCPSYIVCVIECEVFFTKPILYHLGREVDSGSMPT